MLLPLAAFAVLTVGTAFFVAAEFSLVTVDRALIAERAEAGDRRAAQVSSALRRLSFNLSGAQLGITLTALLSGYLAEPALAGLLRPPLRAVPVLEPAVPALSVGLALAVASLLSMLFGELLPKNAALARPLWTARATAPAHRLFSLALRPVIVVLNGSANWVVRRLGIEPQEELASARSPEELGLLAAISARAGALPPETATLLRRTIRFGDKRAGEAMTPRVDVVALSTEATVADLLALARTSGHSRFPVYLGTLDQVTGVASVVDALAVPPADRSVVRVRLVARPPVLVPDSLDLETVLDRLREGKARLAVVVDEYGGTDGIVTAEDLVEELVGDVHDEHDTATPVPPSLPTASPSTAPGSLTTPGSPTAPEPPPAPLGSAAGTVVAGLLRADELLEQTGLRLPDGPYETLGGLLLSLLGHIPTAGESVVHDGWELTVVTVERRRVEQVRVRPPDGHPA